MTFLAVSPAVAFALLAGVAVVIVLLHLLRPPPPTAVVSSVLLWGRLLRGARRPAPRWLISLLLALAAGLCLALALTRPEIPAIGATTQRLALVLDNSASMAARAGDGRTRWEHAVEEAAGLLGSQAFHEATVMDTMGQYPVSRFVERGAARAALEQMHVPGWGTAQVRTQALADAQVHVFTDGVAPIAVPPGAVVHSVFEPAVNFALIGFEARPLAQDPTRYEALVQVLNASPGDRRARVLISGGADFSITQDLDVRAGESVSASFDVSEFTGGVLGAAVVSQGDAFDLDDVAYAVVPPHAPKHVVLVTTGNTALEDALRNLPGVRVSVVPPQAYPAAPAHDALVCDRFAPAAPPATGALLLRPPPRDWLGDASAAIAGVRVTQWDRAHPVTRGIPWNALRLHRASLTTQADGLVSARGSAGGALVSVGEARARWIRLGFSLQDSNFAFQPEFPVFLGNALRWVTEPATVLAGGLGAVEVALRDGQVRDGSGNPVPSSATARRVVFDAARADVYTITGADRQLRVVVNVADPGYALINRSRLRAENAIEPRAPSALASWGMELWMLLVAAAGLLLLAEWTVYTGRARA